MKALCVIFLGSLFQSATAQQQQEHSGWIFGAAAGVSAVHLSGGGFRGETQASVSFPNFRVGRMISDRSAVLVYLPGSIYREKHDGRERDRGFEGIVPVYQYWLTERWWIIAGAGLTMDAPAFYDIEQESERRFYFGPSVLAATGIEVWRKKRFALDIQGRVHYGMAQLPGGKRTAFAGNLLVGCNWYFGKR